MNILTLVIATLLLLSNPSDCTAKNNTGVLGTRPVLRSQAVGSPNKTYTTFDDLKLLADSAFTVRSIVIAAFYQVDSLQFTYTLKDGSIYRPPKRGEGFTTPYTILLAKDEYISKIEGTTVRNDIISQVFITISSPNKYKSRVYGPYGAYVGEQSFTFEGYILGIYGKTGPSFSRGIIRNLGVYYLATSKHSDNIGNETPNNILGFYEGPDKLFPPVVKISKISIRHGDHIDSVQFEYLVLNGSTRLGGKHGGDGGNLTVITFGNDEELIGLTAKIEVTWLYQAIGQVSFVSRKRDGSEISYGPFGNSGNETVSVSGHILGFAGGAGDTSMMYLRAYYYD